MLSKRWDTAGRWCIYALLLIVFVGPFWGIVATAFSGAPVKPGELLARRISSHLKTSSLRGWILASGSIC